MIAVILADGHGECLRHEGDYTPWALIPVGGKPLLEHQLEWLRRAGFDEAVLCLGFKAPEVRARFGDGSALGFKLRYLVEDSPLGSAGAVKSLGPASLPENFLILYGDVYPGTDPVPLIDFHRKHNALATLAVHECAHPEGCDPVVLGPSRRIVEFPIQRPAKGGTALSPLWIIRRALLHLVPETSPSDFVKDVFPAALRRNEPLVGYPEAGVLADLGAPDRYSQLQKQLAKKKSR